MTTQTDPGPSSLQALRGELRRLLSVQRKSSLYGVLGIAADATDQEVAAAIARLTAEGAQPDAEQRYAIDILGRPEAREAFDRQLLDQLRRPRPEPLSAIELRAPRERSVVPMVVAVALLAAILLGGAWLTLNQMQETARRELAVREAEARAEQARRQAEIAAQRAQTERLRTEAEIAAEKRAADAGDRSVEEDRAREERYRAERDKRYQEDLARDEKRRQDYEKSQQDRANRELLNAMTGSAARGALGGR